MPLNSLILAGFGPVHAAAADALPYLALAYAAFFSAIFVYVISLSRRQARVQGELALVRQHLDDDTPRTAPLSAAARNASTRRDT